MQTCVLTVWSYTVSD